MFRAASIVGLLLGSGALASPIGDNPTSSLQWVPCEIDFGFYNALVSLNYSCATLEVPLDYTNPQSASLPLSLIRVNATKAPFKGSVLFNPGGPGGSGIQDVAVTGGLYSAVLGGQYDLIGFDPRGTGKNIPFDCKAWGSNDTNDAPARRDILPQADLTEVLYDWAWNSSTYFSERCATVQADNGRFLSTAFVARDMLQIVDALQEDGLLRYWGTSYGTLLGNTFAAMFPDRIDRMMLDSVVNPLDYMAGYWLTATLDTDKVFLGFLDTCVKAGPHLCAIANFSGPDTTADDLLQLTYDMFEYLLESGLPLGANLTSALWDKDQPGTVYDNLKSILFNYLYSPSTWPLGSQLLQAFLLQDFSLLTQSLNESTNLTEYSEGVDAFWGIACSDSSFRATQPEDMQWLVDAQQNVSTFDDILAPQMWPCYQWKLEAAERYSGDFQAKTSHPILYINGLADPITPAVSAFNASSGFDGSVVLTHGGYGHGFYSDPSLDVARAIRTYFVNGTLPPEGQYFEADFGPFEILDFENILNGSYFDGIKKRSGEAYSEDDKELLQAMFGLSEYHQRKGHHGPLNVRR